jgi:hypothetical protein
MSLGKESRSANKNEQAIRASPNRLLVEDLTAIGYPRPAPSLTASDHVFFEGRTAGPANRSTAGQRIQRPRKLRRPHWPVSLCPL